MRAAPLQPWQGRNGAHYSSLRTGPELTKSDDPNGGGNDRNCV